MFWFLQRIAISLTLLWVVTSLVFLSIYMVPGDPAELLLSGEGASPDPATVAQLRTDLGLDRPILSQYAERMSGLARLDLGNSMIDGTAVSTGIASRLPRTLELVAAAAMLSLLIGIPAGVFAALRQGGRFDRAANFVAGFAQGIPVFVAGTLIILVFAQIMKLVPAGGYVAFSADPGKHLVLLAMPALAIAIGLAAIVFRIVARHILRNALMPVITVFALNLGGLFGGTVLVEYVFNWPGLSGMLVSAVNARDYPSVTAVILVISALFITLNLVVDILYGITDPRVRK